MKKFRTEKIIFFKTKNSQKTNLNKPLAKPKEIPVNRVIHFKKKLFSRKFTIKKIKYFKVKRYDDKIENKKKTQNEGNWTLKEHIQFLQALDKYGIKWKKISKIIRTRTADQIRSHSQKFFRKLKKCKVIELGINFTSENIQTIKDMLEHIKSVNKDFNVATIFLYLSEICVKDKNSKRPKKNINININDILSDDINNSNINNMDDNNDIYKDGNKKSVIDKEESINKQIINNEVITTNDLVNSLIQDYVNNIIVANFINNIYWQNIYYNNLNVYNNYLNNYYSNNSKINKFIINYHLNNLEFSCNQNIKENF